MKTGIFIMGVEKKKKKVEREGEEGKRGNQNQNQKKRVTYLVSKDGSMRFCCCSVGQRWEIPRRWWPGQNGCAWGEDAGQPRSSAARRLITRCPDRGAAGPAQRV